MRTWSGWRSVPGWWRPARARPGSLVAGLVLARLQLRDPPGQPIGLLIADFQIVAAADGGAHQPGTEIADGFRRQGRAPLQADQAAAAPAIVAFQRETGEHA